MRIIRTQIELNALVGEMRTVKRFSFDFETQGLDPHTCAVLLIAVKWGDQRAVIRRHDLDMAGFNKLLADERILKLAQNSKFEHKFSITQLGVEPKRVFCTMLAEQLLNAGKFKQFGLDDILMRRYGLDLVRPLFPEITDQEWTGTKEAPGVGPSKKKEMQLSFVGLPADAEFTDRQYAYALGDVDHLDRLFDDQVGELKKLELVELMKLENSLFPVLARMELEGMPIDEAKWRARLQDLEARKAALEPGIKAVLTPILRNHYNRLFVVAQGNYMAAVKEMAPTALGEYRDTTVQNKTRKDRDAFCAKWDPVIAGKRQMGAVSDLPATVRHAVHRTLKATAESGNSTDKALLPNNAKKLFARLQELDLDGINLNSPDQVVEAYGLAGIDLGVSGLERHEMSKDKKTGIVKNTTDDFALHGALRFMGDRPNFAALKAATADFEVLKKLQKQTSSFGENMLAFLHPMTDRLHADWRQYGAETGRMSAVEPAILTIPNRGEGTVYRTFFITVPGQVVVKADYSQFELRVIAHASKDPAMIAIFEAGQDIHSMTCSGVTGIPYEEIEARKGTDKAIADMRKKAKAVNFGIAFDMKKWTLAKREGMSLDDAQLFIDGWNGTYTVAAEELDGWGKFACNHGYQKTLAGRIRWFPRPPVPEGSKDFDRAMAAIYRAGRNVIPQGTNADATKTAAVAIAEKLKPYCMREVGVFPRPLVGDVIAYPYNLIHDELVAVGPSKHGDRIAEIVQTEMIAAATKWITLVPVLVDVSIGSSWGGD